MPLLVGEELSLDVLRLMRASGELETSLTELGLTRGARFKIAHGLRALYDGGDIGTGAVVGGGTRSGDGTDDTAEEAGGEEAAAASSASSAAAAASSKPQWYLDGNFEDIS